MEKRKQTTLRWLYKKIHFQLFAFIILIIANAFYAFTSILFALSCKDVIDQAVNKNKNGLLYAILLLFLIMLAQLFLRMLCRGLEERTKAKLDMQLKNELLGTLFTKKLIAVQQYHSGELMNRLFNDIVIIADNVTTLLPNLVSMLTRLICAAGVLAALDHQFTFIFLIGGVILLVTSKLFRNKMKALHKQVQETDGKVRSFYQESLMSILVIKIFDIAELMKTKAYSLQKDHYDIRMKRNIFSITANAGFGFIFHLGYLFALSWSAFHLYAGTMSFGTLTAIIQLVSQIQQPFANLTGIFPRMINMLASAERIQELEAMPSETHQLLYDPNILYQQMDSLVLEDISFQFDREIIFSHTNCRIQKHDFIAIEGISGVGKSTLLKLLTAIYTDYEGSIYLSRHQQVPLPLTVDTRCMFCYVPQGNYVFSGTILDNIKMLHPHATTEEVEKAVQLSCCSPFLKKMPQGLQTLIGENGQGLSEGQVQRISIARALLSQAPILLLDEATSALDEATEAQLLKNLQTIPDITVMIVTHKKAALKICNKQIRINDKKIMMTGE